MKSIEEITNKPVTRVAFIIDESSSMGGLSNFVLSTFNEQLKAMIEKSDENEVEISIVFFSDSVNEKQFNVPLAECKEITDKDYRPHGCTALNDAIGLTIDKYFDLKDNDHVMTDDVSYLFIIITDGYENASRKYTTEQIASRIKELEASERWTFTYFADSGTVDLSSIQKTYNFNMSNMRTGSFATGGHYDITRGVTSYLGGRAKGQTMSTSFYAEPKENTLLPDLTEEENLANLEELKKNLEPKA